MTKTPAAATSLPPHALRPPSVTGQCQRWVLVPVVCLLAACAATQGTAGTAPRPLALPQDSRPRSPSSRALSGIPLLPDVVTVVPFTLFHHGGVDLGWIQVTAEVDGRWGTYTLDTGSARFWLNAEYLRPSATGGIDTVTGHEPPGTPAKGFVTVHTLRIGTFVQHLDTSGIGPPVPRGPRNGNIDKFVGHELGTLGLPAMEPFETIIDYGRQRLILIRLDPQGRRLASVPAYTPVGTVPLVPANIDPANAGVNAFFWWGLVGRRGGKADSLALDTGTPGQWSPTTQAQASHQLEQLVRTGHDTRTVSFDGIYEGNLGYAFLRPLGVVGFNLRTRQLILYH